MIWGSSAMGAAEVTTPHTAASRTALNGRVAPREVTAYLSRGIT